MVAVRNKPKVIVLRAAGTNCDVETAFAFEHAGARPELVHINQLVSGEKKLRDYHILAVPGGFTYGDDAGSGKILANELKYKLAGDLKKFVSAGKLIIGICNGFQVLVKSGLLPGRGISGEELEATLTTNDTARYEDRWVYLRVAKGPKTGSQDRCLWTRGIEGMIYIPAAHGEGKFVPKDDEVLGKLWANGQVVFRYVDPHGKLAGFPWNPNGSIDNIAGVCDITGRIFGLMPHPERHLFPSQHPRWTRGEAQREGDGVRIFRNGVKSV